MLAADNNRAQQDKELPLVKGCSKGRSDVLVLGLATSVRRVEQMAGGSYNSSCPSVMCYCMSGSSSRCQENIFPSVVVNSLLMSKYKVSLRGAVWHLQGFAVLTEGKPSNACSVQSFNRCQSSERSG